MAPGVFVLGATGQLQAQLVGGAWETLYRFDGGIRLEQLGFAVDSAGDTDGDGVPDLIVGAGHRYTIPRIPGSAYVYSGATGQQLWAYFGTFDEELGTAVAGVGDLDADGRADFAIGAPYFAMDRGEASAYSGATGALLWQIVGSAEETLGFALSRAGDWDLDGTPDLLIGAPRVTGGSNIDPGAAYVVSGRSGATLHTLATGQKEYDQFGFAVAAAGDVDRDGRVDVICGAPTASLGARGVGSAILYSGGSGALIWQFDAPRFSTEHLGYSVDGIGDVDGDAFPDVIVGSPNADAGLVVRAGTVRVLSGATGSVMQRFDGAQTLERLGLAVSGAGDVEGDGIPDYLMGTTHADYGGLLWNGYARVHSGATGELIFEIVGQSGANLGSVGGAGDLDGDELADIIVGAFGDSGSGVPYSGSASVYSLDPYLHPDSRELSATLGTQVALDLDFPISEAGATYVVLASASGTGPSTLGGLEVPLTQDALLARLLTGWSPPNLLNGTGRLDAVGDARATLNGHPALAAHVGRQVFLAVVSYDAAGPTGRLSSIARTLRIVP